MEKKNKTGRLGICNGKPGKTISVKICPDVETALKEYRFFIKKEMSQVINEAVREYLIKYFQQNIEDITNKNREMIELISEQTQE